MTVIAWDGRTLAADRLGVNGDTLHTVKKLWPLEKGGAIAVSGSLPQGLELKRWVEEGMEKEKFPSKKKDEEWALLIVVLPGKAAVCFENLPEPIEVLDSFGAWGCGREAALGALEMGADAIKAVKVASKWVDGCGRGCDYVVIENKGKVRNGGV